MTDGIVPIRALAGCLLLSASALAQQPEPLRLVARVPMPHVEGRIDHMAIDVAGQRLFVAALGNNTLEVIDLRGAKLQRTIPGLHEPQGVAYTPATNRIYVPNRADGSLHIYDGTSFALVRIIAYGRDADNVRYDAQADVLWVGYGEGGLGAFDQRGAKLREITIGAHPESCERHEHQHAHEAMEHDHLHVHDEHHRHAHSPEDPPGEPHSHPHRHEPLVHTHPHYPDIHHRHGHD